MKSETSLGPLLSLFTDLPPGSTTTAAPRAPRTYTLATGTPVDAALTDVISSRHATAGEPFTARVVDDVRSGTRIVIPAGAIVRGTIVEVRPAFSPGSMGTLTLAVSSMSVRGATLDLAASIDSIDTLHEGRGIETVDAARVAGGAVGAAVSVNLKDRDIVLPAGAHLMLTLRQPLTVAAR